jgi:hypothetical protein
MDARWAWFIVGVTHSISAEDCNLPYEPPSGVKETPFAKSLEL